jgi:hypothetical protein
MSRQVYVYREGLGVIPKEEAPPKGGVFHYMQDIGAFVSPLDRSEITSRSQLREHERRHNVKQCGELRKASDYDWRKSKGFKSVIPGPDIPGGTGVSVNINWE